MGKKIFHHGWLATISLLLAALSPAGFADTSVFRLTPNGDDDREQLQSALDSCSGATPPCQIMLSKGVFHTDVLLVKDFRGRIHGQGVGHTIVRPVAGRPLRSTAVPFLADPTSDEPYPVLLHFADGGDIHLTDFTLEFPEDMQVEPYDVGGRIKDALLSAIMVDGTETARLVVSHLEIIATERRPEMSRFGSALLNAIRFEGQIRLVNGMGTATPLAGGEFVAHDTSIRGAGLGFALRDLTNVNARIVNNDVQDVRLLGVFLNDMGNSHTLVADNRIASEVAGVQIARGNPRPPEEPSTFNVARNTITINAHGTSIFVPSDGGITFGDLTPGEGIDRALMTNNDIVLGEEVLDGIFVLGDRGHVRIEANQISGSALDAGIVLDDSHGTRTRHNRFSDLVTNVADVWLTSTTSECEVIEPEATVRDEGSNNKVRAQTVITP
jgi:Right handed beta helix region